jgi:hypothetical protein
MSAVLLIAFAMSIFCVIFFVIRSTHSVLVKAATIAIVFTFAALAYFLATSSPISPFSRPPGTSFGTADNATIASIGISLVGAVGGVFGSYIFNLGTSNISLRALLRPLSACPLVIIPTIKLIESTNDETVLAYLLLFALSYQNGFFWERLLKSQ